MEKENDIYTYNGNVRIPYYSDVIFMLHLLLL